MIFITIVATANHYFLDTIAAASFAVLAWLANEALCVFLPAEDLLFWCLRAEKPEPTVGAREGTRYEGERGSGGRRKVIRGRGSSFGASGCGSSTGAGVPVEEDAGKEEKEERGRGSIKRWISEGSRDGGVREQRVGGERESERGGYAVV